MVKAFALGVTILIAAVGLWFIALHAEAIFSITGILLWLSLSVAAFLTACLAPRNKIFLGTALAIPASILLGASNLIYEAFGNAVDFSGFGGALLLTGVALPFNAALCAVGAIAGHLVGKLKSGSE